MLIGVEGNLSLANMNIGESKYDLQHLQHAGTAMLVFVQFVRMDSLASIYFPLVKRPPGLVIFFLFLIVMMSIAMTKEAAIADGTADKDMERRRVRMMIPGIQEAFDKMDANLKGIITRREVADKHEHLPPALLEVVPEDQIIEVFDLLGSDNSGELTKDKFVEGVIQLLISDVTFENLHHMGILRRMEQVQLDAKVEIDCVRENIKGVQQQLYAMERSAQERSAEERSAQASDDVLFDV